MLTIAQQDVFEYICDHWRDMGRSPTLVEIADNFGWYPNAAGDHVKALRKKGYLEEAGGRHRDIYPKGLKEHIRMFHGKPVASSSNGFSAG